MLPDSQGGERREMESKWKTQSVKIEFPSPHIGDVNLPLDRRRKKGR